MKWEYHQVSAESLQGLEGDSIRLTLPGNKKMTFRKIR
jgi:hypothetical protein